MPAILGYEQILSGTELSYERGVQTGTRKYLVRYDNRTTLLAAVDVLDSAGLPAYLDAWDASWTELRVRSRSCEPVPGSEMGTDDNAHAWIATITYSSASASTSTVEPSQPGWIQPSVDGDAALMDHWRLPSGSPAAFAYFPTTIDQPAYTDIGGLKVDMDGEPIDALVRNITLAVTNVYEAEPNAFALSAYVATRNDVAFLGAAIGKLCMLPFQKTRLDSGYWSVEWRLMWDAYAHMRQMPVINEGTGQPAWAYSTIGAVNIRQVEYVIWRQPFRLASSHGLTWDDLPISVA